MTESRDRSTPSRREFLRLAAAAGLAGTLPAATAALAQVSPAPKPPQAAQPPAPAVAPVPPPSAPTAPEAPSEAARALTAILQQRLGKDRLTPEQWESVTRDFDGDFAAGKRLAATKFANGDEPDYSFTVAKG